MASPDRRESTGVDRRASMRTSMRLSRQPDDEDEYALAAMGISDGFRPADMAAGPQQPAPQSISSNVELPPVRRASPPPRPSSISKPKMDSFALRHDGQMGPVTQRNIEPVMTGASSSSSQMPSRMSSASSINPYVRPESPYRGPSGPSHNYGMYSQESRAQRTASISTTATVPVVERNYTGPSGPTHPYGMYPQNTVPEVEHPSPIAQIPVGFPGHNNNTQFQRRIGPEGEEAGGIIGPDGHQEELPPYTQYPDEAFARKTRPTIVAPVLVPGAGGMGVATRNPEFDSREGSVNTPQSRQSTRSFASDGSVHQVNTAAMGASEKPELKHWQIVARRKLCGIVPIWVLVLVFSMFVLFGIILGSVFAALKPKNQHKQSSHPTGQAQSQVTTTMTTTFDATPFTTVPAGLSSLPTGTFALPIQIPITVQSSCIDNSAQSSAWACNIAQGSQLQMNVQSIPGTNPTQSNEVMIDLGNDSMNVFPYGAQPPVVTTSQVMSLVTDSQDTNKGPAWFFQLPYNKLVVLPENALSASNTKREAATFNQIGDFMRRGVAQPGDRPWFCYWNGTLLEAFIYVNLTSSAASQSQTTTSSAASTASRTGSASAASSTSSSSDDDDPTFLAPYPRVIKVEERRVPEGGQTISPYCIQQVIDQNGSPSPALNSTGQQIRLYLNETEPTTVSPISDKRDLFAALEPRDGHPLSERASDANCGCVWMYS